MGAWGLLLILLALAAPADESRWQPLRPATSAGDAGTPVGPPTSEAEDWALETRARAALWRDAALADLGLEVIVRDGVATLFGPIPDESLGRRADEVVQNVPGVRGVRNRTRVRVPPNPKETRPRIFPPVDQPFRAEPSQKARPADPVLPWAARLMGQGESGGSGSLGTWRPRAGPEQETTVAKPRAEQNPSAVSIGLARLIHSNPRFRGLEFSVADGRVTLSGTLAQEADLADLVRAVSAFDGVETISSDQVVVQRKR